MALTVTLFVQSTVRTEHVTLKMEHVLGVCQDGRDHTVNRVRWHTITLYFLPLLQFTTCTHLAYWNYWNFFGKVFFFYIIESIKSKFSSIWEECKPGWYGINCSKVCEGQCRNGTFCNHVTGQCEGGCDAGWTGTKCAKGSCPQFISHLIC